MKNMKKVLALVVALLVVLASLSAFAAAPTKGTITITNSNDGTVTASTRKFKAYRIFDATEIFGNGDAKPATGYSYTIPNANVKAAVATYLGLTQNSGETDIAFEQRIIAGIAAKTTATDIEAMAKVLLKIAKEKGLTAVELTGGTASDALDFGYYVIEDVTSPEDPNVSAVMLDTNNPNVEIKVKASKPTIDKKIDEGTTTGRYDASDLVYDDHSIGDKVPYVLKSNIPEMTGFTKYYYYITDTMSKGLKFNNDVVIKAYGKATDGAVDDASTTDIDESKETVRTLVKDTDYTVTVTPNDADGSAETTIEIVFKDFYNKEKDHAGETLEITYSATVTKDAIIGVEGNPNTAKLIYSNNPNDDYSSEPTGDKPSNEKLVSKTPNSTVRTYVTGLKVVKVDESSNRLSGATFELAGDKLNKVEVLTADKFVVDAAGEYFLLKDGSYTKTDPTTLNSEAEDYAENIAKYVTPDGSVKYKETTTVTYSEKDASSSHTVSETTTAGGVIVFDGMMKGNYTLTETAAPTGYNKLTTPIEFTINWAKPADKTDGSGDCTWSVTNKTTGYNVSFDPIANEFIISIENKTGTELPETGGIGTTIFYVAGGILVLAAVILLVTKRRMSAED